MMFQCEYTCTQPNGLTLLAALHIVKLVLRSYSEASIEANGRCVKATDVKGVLSLSIKNGDMVTVTVDGGDGYDVMRNIEAVLARGIKPEGCRVDLQLVSA